MEKCSLIVLNQRFIILLYPIAMTQGFGFFDAGYTEERNRRLSFYAMRALAEAVVQMLLQFQ